MIYIQYRICLLYTSLSHELSAGDSVEPVFIHEPDGLNVLRHSAAHVMAQAVQEYRKDAKLGIGPYITDGFYFDFDVAEPFTPEDLKKIEKSMMKIIKSGQLFRRRVVTHDEAVAEMANEPYKLELLSLTQGPGSGADAAEGASVEVGEGEITIYDNCLLYTSQSRLMLWSCANFCASGLPAIAVRNMAEVMVLTCASVMSR